MTTFYITGTSQGIGKAIAELALQDEESFVFGISRSCSINHKSYTHITADLSNVDEVLKIKFPKLAETQKVVLINNAGIIGEVKPIGELADESIAKVFKLNTICPAVLSNKFIQTFKGLDLFKIIINISSGAGRHPIESWATYCASKAALDMFSQVQHAENGYDNSKLRIFSIAPGIVDTNMQQQLRSVDAKDFPHLDKFIGYKTKGQLASAETVAKKILDVIKKPGNYKDVLLDARQF